MLSYNSKVTTHALGVLSSYLVTLHVFHYGNFLHEHQDVQDV